MGDEINWNDLESVMQALKNGHSLKNANDRFQNNYDLVKYAVEIDGLNLQYASEELRKEPFICYLAVKQNGLALPYCRFRSYIGFHSEDNYYYSKDIIETAVDNNIDALQFVGNSEITGNLLLQIVNKINK